MKTRRIALPVMAVIVVVMLAAAGSGFASDNTALSDTNLPTLPAPDNVKVVNGDYPGEVVVSWDKVPDASGYQIQWVDNDAAWDAHYAGHDWQRLILSSDVAGSETTSQTLVVSNPTTGAAQYQFRAGSKSVSDSEPASWSVWRALEVQGDADKDLQALAAAIRISRLAGQLVAFSGPTTTAMTPDTLVQSGAAIAAHKANLAAQLEALAGTGYDARAAEIERLVNSLGSNADLIQKGRGQLLAELLLGIRNRQSVTINSTIKIIPAAETGLDDEFYDLLTGASNAGSPDISIQDLLRYSHLKNLATTLDLATPTLLGASTQDNPALAGQIHEFFDGRAAAAARDIEFLKELDDPRLGDVIQLIEEMFARGQGDDNLWDGLYRRLGLITRERVLVANVANIQQQLLGEINRLVADVQGDPQPSSTPLVKAGDPGITDKEIKFGQSAVLTGPTAALGEGMRLGVQAAFHEVNQAGGIHGRKLTLKTINDHYEPYFAFSATSKLVNRDGVFGMIGAVGTPTTRAALPSVEAGHVPFVGAFTGAQLIRRDDQTYVLNVRASYHDEARAMVDSLEEMGKTRVAVLYQNDSFGHDGLIGVEKALQGRDDMELVASWYYIRNTSAVKSAAYRIANAKPDAVIIVGTYTPAAEFIRYMRLRLDDAPIFMAVSFVSGDALKDRLEELDQSLADVYVTEVTPSPDDESNPLVARYQAALAKFDPEAEPGFTSLEGYMAGRLAIERLKECGPDVTRECFLDVFDESTTVDIGGLELEFGPMDNQGSDNVSLMAIQQED